MTTVKLGSNELLLLMLAKGGAVQLWPVAWPAQNDCLASVFDNNIRLSLPIFSRVHL